MQLPRSLSWQGTLIRALDIQGQTSRYHPVCSAQAEKRVVEEMQLMQVIFTHACTVDTLATRGRNYVLFQTTPADRSREWEADLLRAGLTLALRQTRATRLRLCRYCGLGVASHHRFWKKPTVIIFSRRIDEQHGRVCHIRPISPHLLLRRRTCSRSRIIAVTHDSPPSPLRNLEIRCPSQRKWTGCQPRSADDERGV